MNKETAFGLVVTAIVLGAALFVLASPHPSTEREAADILLDIHSDGTCVHVRALVVGQDAKPVNYRGNLSVWVVYEDGRESMVTATYKPGTAYSFMPSAGVKQVYALSEELKLMAVALP